MGQSGDFALILMSPASFFCAREITNMKFRVISTYVLMFSRSPLVTTLQMHRLTYPMGNFVQSSVKRPCSVYTPYSAHEMIKEVLFPWAYPQTFIRFKNDIAEDFKSDDVVILLDLIALFSKRGLIWTFHTL